MLFSAQVNASLGSRKLQFYCELFDAKFDSIVLDKPVGGAVGRLIQLALSFDSCLFKFLILMVFPMLVTLYVLMVVLIMYFVNYLNSNQSIN